MQHSGLSTQKAQELLKQYGPNRLPDKKTNTALKIFFSQIKNPLVLLLLFAGILSFFIGDQIDSFLIMLILFLNIGLGFWQEYKASKELEALRKLEVFNSRVIRDSKEIKIPSSELVPGDLIILESGDKINADAKIIESVNFMVNEASLTGESLPVIKSNSEGDNLIYFGTIATSGRSIAQVLKTGADTRFGSMAITLQTIEEETTPLEASLARFAKIMGLVAVLIAIAIFAIRFYQGGDLYDVLFTSTALMVAAVPEGLPAVITIVLAIGVQRMYRKKALVRKMIAIESLGETTVILTDKTGTLTKNEMRVNTVETENKESLLKCAVLCNSANLVLKEDSPRSAGGAGHGTYDILGDTTEGALLIWARDVHKTDIDNFRLEHPIIEEIPFSLKTRQMMVLVKEKSQNTLFVKGSPESILEIVDLSDAKKQALVKRYQALAQKGLRIIGAASKDYARKQKINQKETDLTFLGFIAIADEARVEAKDAVLKAKKAGISVVMVTGDNELTAKFIGEKVGILADGDEVMTGSQLEELTDEEILPRLRNIKVFARVIPEHKLRIVKLMQSLGEIVAVTGDGVNDALALKQAHVGVAMGITGTDVAKEASDIIILDDNFVTIVSAVEEGRLIYSNVTKVIRFLLAGNFSEVLLVVAAVLLNAPTPLLPVQILWINFVTDGLPALSLAATSSSSSLMLRTPRKNNSLLGGKSLKIILLGGITIGLICLGVFFTALQVSDLSFARSLTFSLMVVLQMILVWIIKGPQASNKYLIGSIILVLALQAAIMTIPALQGLFLTR